MTFKIPESSILPEAIQWYTTNDITKTTEFYYYDSFKNLNLTKGGLISLGLVKETKVETSPKIKQKKLGELYNYKKLSKYVGLEGSIPMRASSTYVGVEIELEKCKYTHIPTGTWQAVEDHSLKEQGIEFVTCPIQVKYLEAELNRLYSGITSCSISSRCSVHVHLNVRDFTMEELTKFLVLYMIFERSLYRFSGDRWKNNFCVPLFSYTKAVSYFLEGAKIYQQPLEQWYKYYGLNLAPIWGSDSSVFGTSKRYGTVEFRHMEGTKDISRILSWINLIVSLKIAAKCIKLEELLTHLSTMNTASGYYWLADYVFKKDSVLISRQPTFKEDVEMCITKTKEVFLTENSKVHIQVPIILKGSK